MRIELYLKITETCKPNILIEFNGQPIDAKLSTVKNNFGHYPVVFDVDPVEQNMIKLSITGLGKDSIGDNKVNVFDAVIDDINFGLVHVMNSWAYPEGLAPQKGATELDRDGYIEIPFDVPVALYWGKVHTEFKFEDFPGWIS